MRARVVLHWDRTGLGIYAKSLERGRFARLWRDEGEVRITLTASELDRFLDGSTLVPAGGPLATRGDVVFACI